MQGGDGIRERCQSTDSGTATPRVFVVAAQRSGTTLLRLMLDDQPNLAVLHEFDFGVSLVSDQGEWPELRRCNDFVERQGSFRCSGLRVDPSLDYPNVMERLRRQRQGGKQNIGMVVHHAFERLLFLWPNARFIYLVRDPRDVALLLVGRGWAADVWMGVERWLEAERR